jgi:type II secretory pathway pseudopilin PulG
MKKAFTLAEALIVIGIIGVVAAITMPVLMNYMQGSYITQAQKMYYDIHKLFRGVESELGTYENWPDFYFWTMPVLTEFCDTYISPRLQYVEKSPPGTTNIYPPLQRPDLTYTYLLQNGAVLMFSATDSGALFIRFDTNGAAEPNIIGVDFFQMILITDPANNGAGGNAYGLNPTGIALSEEEKRSRCARGPISLTWYQQHADSGAGVCLAYLVETNWDKGKYPITKWGK